MRISDWSSDVCSSDLHRDPAVGGAKGAAIGRQDARIADRAVGGEGRAGEMLVEQEGGQRLEHRHLDLDRPLAPAGPRDERGERSEEHTSELQSLMRISYAVFCLKKKNSA